METTTIYFFEGDTVKSETVPVQQLPQLSASRTFWRGDAFTDQDRENMMRERARRHFLQTT